MRKRDCRFLSFLLIFSIWLPCVVAAKDLVGLKNLSWEEQKNQTRIILETSEPLVYNVIAVPGSTEIQVELMNLDLRNLPQELFINTNEVVSLQTFPQNGPQNARIAVKMTSALPHAVMTEGLRLNIDILASAPAGNTLLGSAAAPAPTPEPVAVSEAPKTQEITEQAAPAAPAPVTASKKNLEPATEIREVLVQEKQGGVDVVLVGNGSFEFDVFELNNPSRIVVDLKSVSVMPGVRSINATDTDMFSRVRVAQYQASPRIARAVIDLNQKVPYEVVPAGAELRIHLGQKSEAAMEPEPQTPETEIASAPDADIEPVAQQQAEPEQLEPVTVEPEPQAPVVMADAEVPELKSATTPAPAVAAPEPQSNEQFFSFKPDTSLFAQESGTTGTTGSTGETTPTGVGGMGTFEDKTVNTGEKQYSGEPFSFDFKDIDIKDLFRFIADISGLNVILDPAVKGSVTLKLTEVPWDQALDLITKNQKLGYTIEGNVIRIAPLSTIVEEEKNRARAREAEALNAPIITKIRPLSYARATEIDRVVKRLLTVKGSSITDARTNTIIITDIVTNMDAIISLIDTLDSRTAQVLIEARIVETTKNFSQAFGIQWGFRGIVDPAFGNNTTLQFPNNILVSGNSLSSTQGGIQGNPLGGYAVNLPTNTAPNSAVLLSTGNILDTFRLDLALMALENTGNGRVISSPKVATQNNTAAEILQGTQIPVQTIANNTITTTFVNAALRLQVTPQITAENTVIMQVAVENNRPDFNNVVFGTPPIVTERATTTLLVEDGGTTVIGGIFTASDQFAQGRTPVLHRIPLLGWLFKNSNIVRENRELLIFLTPRILR